MIKVSGYRLSSPSFTNNSEKPAAQSKTKRPLSMEEKIGLTSALVILGSIGLYFATRKPNAVKKNLQKGEEILERELDNAERLKINPPETVETVKPLESIDLPEPLKGETAKPFEEVKKPFEFIDEDAIIKNTDEGENIVFAEKNEAPDFIEEDILLKNTDEVENTDFDKITKPEDVIDVLEPKNFLSGYDADLKPYSNIIEEDNIVIGEEAVTPKKGGFTKFINKLAFWKKK